MNYARNTYNGNAKPRKLFTLCVSQEAEERKAFAANYIKEIAHTVLLTERKKKKLDEILPELFAEMVEKAMADLEDLDSCMKGSLEKIKQK